MVPSAPPVPTSASAAIAIAGPRGGSTTARRRSIDITKVLNVSVVTAAALDLPSQRVEEPISARQGASSGSACGAPAARERTARMRARRSMSTLLEDVGEEKAVEHDRLVAGRAGVRDDRDASERITVVGDQLAVAEREHAHRRRVEAVVAGMKVRE